MATPNVSERDVLVQILIELRVLNRQIAETNASNQDPLLSLRTDEENAVGWTSPSLVQKDS